MIRRREIRTWNSLLVELRVKGYFIKCLKIVIDYVIKIPDLDCVALFGYIVHLVRHLVSFFLFSLVFFQWGVPAELAWVLITLAYIY
jgi:hypothetical protein